MSVRSLESLRAFGLGRASFAIAVCIGVLAGCAGGASPLTPPNSTPVTPEGLAPAAAAKLKVKPPKLAPPQGTSQKVVVSEANYHGSFTSSSPGAAGCKGVASWSPQKGKGPSFTVTIKALSLGTCQITFADAAKHVVKLTVAVGAPPAPDYVYVVNGGSNDVSQLAFNADGSVSAIAPNFPLPTSCTDASGIAVAPVQSMAFVICRSGSGEIVPINISANRTLTASPIAPVPVEDASAIIVPQSGVPGALYVSGNGPGAGINAYAFTTSAITPIATYTSANLPTQMAFYTSPHLVSTLYAAASDFAQCSGSPGVAGAVEPWQQNSDGSLTEQTIIPGCGNVGNVAVANGNLFWAGSTVWGGYSLTQGVKITMPAVRWPAGSGPAYPTSMSTVEVQPSTAHAPTAFIVGASNGTLYVNSSENGSISIDPLLVAAPDVARCRQFSPSFSFQGKGYQYVCWSIAGNGLLVAGENGSTATPIGAFPTTGTGPSDLAVVAASEFK
jgi:hypothetical protein